MNHIFGRAALLVICLCGVLLNIQAQQPNGPRRGGLDSLSLISTPGGATSDGTWQLFAPEGAGFAVLVPGTPEEATKAGHEAGTLAAQFRGYQLTAADGVKYEFGRTGQLPAEITGRSDFNEKFFAHNAEMMLYALQHENPQLQFELKAERNVTVAGSTGREYEFAAPGFRSVARVFLVDRAIFALTISGTDTALTDDKANKFFDSFSTN